MRAPAFQACAIHAGDLGVGRARTAGASAICFRLHSSFKRASETTLHALRCRQAGPRRRGGGGGCEPVGSALRAPGFWGTSPTGSRTRPGRGRGRRAAGRQPDGDVRCVTWRPHATACKMSPRRATKLLHGGTTAPCGSALRERPFGPRALRCAPFVTSQRVAEASPSRVQAAVGAAGHVPDAKKRPSSRTRQAFPQTQSRAAALRGRVASGGSDGRGRGCPACRCQSRVRSAGNTS